MPLLVLDLELLEVVFGFPGAAAFPLALAALTPLMDLTALTALMVLQASERRMLRYLSGPGPGTHHKVVEGDVSTGAGSTEFQHLLLLVWPGSQGAGCFAVLSYNNIDSYNS